MSLPWGLDNAGPIYGQPRVYHSQSLVSPRIRPQHSAQAPFGLPTRTSIRDYLSGWLLANPNALPQEKLAIKHFLEVLIFDERQFQVPNLFPKDDYLHFLYKQITLYEYKKHQSDAAIRNIKNQAINQGNLSKAREKELKLALEQKNNELKELAYAKRDLEMELEHTKKKLRYVNEELNLERSHKEKELGRMKKDQSYIERENTQKEKELARAKKELGQEGSQATNGIDTRPGDNQPGNLQTMLMNPINSQVTISIDGNPTHQAGFDRPEAGIQSYPNPNEQLDATFPADHNNLGNAMNSGSNLQPTEACSTSSPPLEPPGSREARIFRNIFQQCGRKGATEPPNNTPSCTYVPATTSTPIAEHETDSESSADEPLMVRARRREQSADGRAGNSSALLARSPAADRLAPLLDGRKRKYQSDKGDERCERRQGEEGPCYGAGSRNRAAQWAFQDD